MIYVEQPNWSTGCGIAVMAMLRYSDYEKTKVWVLDNSFCNPALLVNLEQMRNAIKLIYGVSELKYQNTNNDKFDESQNYVCHGRWDDAKSGDRHWIICYQRKYYDPVTGVLSEIPSDFHITQVFPIP
ncbi:hypothetical protein [Xenorhabdus griffiniae]|uniref:Peptidase C39-like domain-containing protein n=1 Tax=Xenorhabdus griffiniae TaxID=351672 RepID=A0ABY9XD88_9GAMM|nr:hypothetical protein [Xenorhabdus griffiniae]MBD1228059.1 hypothetical protein [Xenorhabdus griffiniae]MBE8587479.1 hypothetical protein [Xenorhabdus griffiniae]WMV70885.1 hypothetical protein QL128_11720 [Xenorhabdus griffiniae]WNH00561.1 hypothetical protein QL112_011725 [Xenorhabdus griffiniae]